MHRYHSDGLLVIDSNAGEERAICQAANPFTANLIAYRLNQALSA